MRAIDKFRRFGRKVYNSQDVLQNHILQRFPIHYTDDTNDLSQVDQYADTTDYVWLVDNSIDVYRSFPFWFRPLKPEEQQYRYLFPYVYKDSKRVRSWKKVQLVPTKNKDAEIITPLHICGEYDVLMGKARFDVFFLGDKTTGTWKDLQERFPFAIAVDSYQDAIDQSETNMFWIVWDDLVLDKKFNFDFMPIDWDFRYPHMFANGNPEQFDGVALMPKKYRPTENEIEYRFFITKKQVKRVASKPRNYDIFNLNNYADYQRALTETRTDMFWYVPSDVTVDPDFKFDLNFSFVNGIDRKTTHVFKNGNEYDGIALFSKGNLVSEKEFNHRFYVKKKEWDIVASTPTQYDYFDVGSYSEYLNAFDNSKTEMFWVSSRDIAVKDDFDLNLYFTHHDTFNRNINHVFCHKANNEKLYKGLFLCSKNVPLTEREVEYRMIANRKEWDIVASHPRPHDIVFISNDEENADASYNALKEKFPRAKRVHGVKGIHQAHIEAAKLCTTSMIWIVDADAEVVEKFNFDYYVPSYDLVDKKTVHVWKSQNPINSLEYGYGAVKLLPREMTLNMDTSKPDMTTSISSMFKIINSISNITRFNTDPYNTWKSAFRETVKLASRTIDGQLDEETDFRLNAWCTKGKTKLFGEYCIAGAKAGKEYGTTYAGDVEALRMINDFDWLEEQFKQLGQLV